MRVDLLNQQAEFLTNEKKFLLLLAGVGFGKTFIGAHYILKRCREYPKALHFIGANTYAQLRDSTLATMFKVLTDLSIPFAYNQNHGLLKIAGTKVLCKSMENFNVLRGIEIGTFWLDEVRDLRKEAFDMMMGRLRDKNAKKLEGRLTTSPAGFNWLHDYFDPQGELHNPEFGIIHATSHDNVFLPDGYLDSIKSQYSEQFYRQEILGQFVNLTSGKAYSNYGPHNLLEQNPFAQPGQKLSKHLPIVIAMDFNNSPMAWTLGQCRVSEVHWFDEIWIKDTNTQEAATELVSRVTGHDPGVILIGDATGKALKTSAVGRSDYDIIISSLKAAGIKYKNLTPESNPLVKDRVNTMNSKLKSATGDVCLTFNPKKCPKLKKDLERVVWKEGASAILDQTTDKELTHASDGVGYAHCVLTPIKSGQDVGRLHVIIR